MYLKNYPVISNKVYGFYSGTASKFKQIVSKLHLTKRLFFLHSSSVDCRLLNINSPPDNYLWSSPATLILRD